MKTSVLIIAHNEERHIRQCIELLLNQTRTPDEIILLIHNSTDGTATIAREYPIVVHEYKGPHGIPYARIEGLNHVHGDIILCIDGDSFPAINWTEVMCNTIDKGNILAGSWVKFKGTAYGTFATWLNRTRAQATGKKAIPMIWGPSFAFFGKDKQTVTNIYQDSIRLTKELKLLRNPEDYFLAVFMNKKGTIEVTNNTFVTVNVKETNSFEHIKRILSGSNDAKIISRFIGI